MLDCQIVFRCKVTVMIMFAVLLNCFYLPAASAQEGDEPAGEQRVDPRKEIDLDLITVTAQKQEEKVQDIPLSISVFNGVNIEDMQIGSVSDLADFVPNLMIYQHDGSGMNAPTMRGISAPPESFRVSTGLYVDGVPEVSGIGFEEGMLDIERIEVLRGPQGTLYGKGTEAGVINIITRPLDNDFRGKVAVVGGEDETRQLSVNMSGPIIADQLFFGVAGQYYSKDGYIKNTTTGDLINDREHWFGKGRLRWTPSDKMDISLAVSRLEYDEGEPNMNLGKSGVAMFGLPAPQDRKVSSNLDGWNKSNSDIQSLKMTYTIDDSLSLTSITTNRVYHQHTLTDWDSSVATLMHAEKDNYYRTLSQEVRLNFSSERLKGLLGLYYGHDKFDIDYETFSVIPGMASVTSRDYESDTYAVFANLTYALTNQLNLVTGLRYENEKKDFTDNNTQVEMDGSWSEVTPKIALEYRLNPELMVYASISKGYRTGGFNALAVTNPQYYTYDAETLWSYELGVKSAFFDNRLLVNSAIYYMDIKDMQVNEAVTPMESYLTNAAGATGMGVEIDATVRVSDELSLLASFGYNDIEFDSFSDAAGDYDGNKNPYAPQYTYNLGGQYRHGSGFYCRADLVGYGKIYFDKANNSSRDAYAVVNGKIGYEASSFDLYLYAKNLFDKEYNSDEYYGGFFTIYSDPREVGVQLVYRF